MASALDFNTLNPTPQFNAAQYQMQAGAAASQAGAQQTRLKDLYENRTVPDLYSREGAQGNLYSGGAGVAGDRAKSDYAYQSGSITDQLRSTLANLTAQRLYSFLGL